MTFRLEHHSYSLPESGVSLKDPYSQPLPFSMSSKLLVLHGEAKFYCFTVSCVPVNYLYFYLQIVVLQ